MKAAPKSAVDLVKHFESLELRAYRCPAGVWTIGYGHTKGVKPGDTCTEAEAEELLAMDMMDAVEAVDRLVEVPLCEHHRAALISFVFNVGTGAFRTSTLLKILNQGDYEGVPAQLARWNKGGGRVLAGLVRRRAHEIKLWKGI